MYSLLIAHRNMVLFDGDISVYMLISVETCSNSGIIGDCLFSVLVEFCKKGKVSVHNMKAGRE